MGLFRDVKAGTLGDEAREAYEAGARVFIARLNFPMTAHNMSGQVPDWSLMVDAVERQGWRLDEWSVGHDVKGRPEAFPVFRRA